MAVLFVCCSLCGQVPSSLAEGDSAALEYQVKAAFIVNFLKFIELPPEAFTGDTKTITVCLVGNQPTVAIVESLLAGKKAGDRKVEVVKYPDVARMSAGGKMFHVVFLMSPARVDKADVVASLRKSAWLSIGEGRGFCKNGGVVGFRIDSGKVRFDINVQAARQAKLKISSHLLNLANVVGPD